VPSFLLCDCDYTLVNTICCQLLPHIQMRWNKAHEQVVFIFYSLS
jgi:hypothetical protein